MEGPASELLNTGALTSAGSETGANINHGPFCCELPQMSKPGNLTTMGRGIFLVIYFLF